MASELPSTLRTAGKPGAEPTADGAAPLSSGMSVNVVTELVVDLLAATGLVPADKLALVRSQAAHSSITQAMIDKGVAPAEGIARSLAVRYQVPLVDLALAGVDKEAAQAVPLHVLERVVAIPYALDDGTLRIAIADPGNIHGIDELRLATRYAIELGVASRDDVLAEIKRMVRASEAFGARAVLEEARATSTGVGGGRRATTSRPRTASPTRRSSASSTPSSSRRPRTAPRTSTSSRRRTRSSSASASTACCRRCSASRSG